MFEQTTNQLQISQSSAEFITDANCVSSVSLASGKTVSIDNDGIFTFSHFSSELHNNGFFTAGPTGFTGFFTAGRFIKSIKMHNPRAEQKTRPKTIK